MKSLVVLFSLLFATAPASAETAAECKKRLGNEVTCFIMDAQYTHLSCSLSVKLALMDNTAQGKVRDCISDAHAGMGDYYKAALTRLAKAPSGIALLKDAYATWQTTIGSLYPNPGEARFHYNARLASQEQALKEKLNRLDLEAPEPRLSKTGAAEQKKKQDKMRSCSADASAQGLRGDDRRQFMAQCFTD